MSLYQTLNRLPLLLFLSSLQTASPALAQCRLCAPSVPTAAPTAPQRPLSITINAELDFSRAALIGQSGGVIAIDPATGQRTVSGALQDLGGPSLRATVHLTGEPLRHVRVQLPTSVALNASGGDKADIKDLVTNLSADPVIGPGGTLDFSFGGRLRVGPGIAGDFHGRVQIVADYQ
jgi:Domain of unknown function (DUF4402)